MYFLVSNIAPYLAARLMDAPNVVARAILASISGHSTTLATKIAHGAPNNDQTPSRSESPFAPIITIIRRAARKYDTRGLDQKARFHAIAPECFPIGTDVHYAEHFLYRITKLSAYTWYCIGHSGFRACENGHLRANYSALAAYMSGAINGKHEALVQALCNYHYFTFYSDLLGIVFHWTAEFPMPQIHAQLLSRVGYSFKANPQEGCTLMDEYIKDCGCGLIRKNKVNQFRAFSDFASKNSFHWPSARADLKYYAMTCSSEIRELFDDCAHNKRGENAGSTAHPQI